MPNHFPCNPTPNLEALAAFAMTFLSGVVCAITMVKYIDKVRNDTIDYCKNMNHNP